jgi:rare lipoprotein A
MRFILLPSLLLCALYLGGCTGPSLQSGTPVIQKHAKRGYNKPYKIKGKQYHPQKHYEYTEVGLASYYGGGDVFHGRKTSTGERFSMHGLTAAHKTLPLPCVVRVTNLNNGRSIKVKVNDRGPFVGKRIIDMSRKSARVLGFERQGVCKVRIEALVSESIQLAKTYNPNASSNTRSAAYRYTSKPPQKSPRQHSRPAPAHTPIKGKHYVQLGTYSSMKNAQQVAASWSKKMKSSARVATYKKGQKTYYRVLTGPYASSQSAKNLIHKIGTSQYKGAFVVTH